MNDRSLRSAYPRIADEWNSAKNVGSPDEILPSSNKSIYWDCPWGHTYSASINNRTRRKLYENNCPFCNGTKVLPKFNDLEFLDPHVAAQWNVSLNGGLQPNQVTSKSNLPVWWTCPICGASWKTKVYHRVYGRGCPFCEGQEPMPGTSDVMTIYPDLVPLWSAELNKEHTLADFTPGSHFQAFWHCDRGHIYQAPITSIIVAWDKCISKRQYDRLLRCGCPVCNFSKKIVRGENDLQSQAPWLMSEWDFDANKVNPWEIAVHSNILVSWRCTFGHTWRATPNNRCRTGCPFCNTNRRLPGVNTLDVIDPVVASQWSPKNLPLTPRDVTAFCNNKYLWVCPLGHEWYATVANRHLGEGCPACTHHKATSGSSDLATVFPLIAAQLHPELNHGLHAEEILSYSNQVLVWICDRGHNWSCSVYSRTLMRTECPICKGRKKTPRINI